jgi:hypothetical protein
MAQLVGVSSQLIEVLSVEDIATAADPGGNFGQSPPPPPASTGVRSGARHLSGLRGVAVRFAVRMSTPKAAAAVTTALTTALAPLSAEAAASYAQFAAAGLVSSVVIGGITLSDTFTAAPPPPAPPPGPPAPSPFGVSAQAALSVLIVVPLCVGVPLWLRSRRRRKLEVLRAEAQAKLEWVYEDKATAAAHYREAHKPSRRASGADLYAFSGLAAAPSGRMGRSSAKQQQAQQPAPAGGLAGWWGAAAETQQAQHEALAPARVASGRYAPAPEAVSRPHHAPRLGPDGQPLPRRKRKHKKYHMRGFKELDPNLM